MSSRPVTVVTMTAVAVLGYLGVYRLGRWLDGPLVQEPDHAEPHVETDRTGNSANAARSSEQDRSA